MRDRDRRSPLIMAVVNVTPDSFSDGGRYLDERGWRARIDQARAEGADILDIGGESTRPGSLPVPAEVQIARTHDAVRYALSTGALVSIDTSDPLVASNALSLGACIINDVSCLRDGPALAAVAAQYDAALIVMHAREPMHTMKGFSQYPSRAYTDVVADVAREWSAAAQAALQAGVQAQELWLDPGLGFNKNAQHSLELIRRLPELAALGYPLVLGPSRKSFVASQVQSEPTRRLGGTIAACLACVRHGARVLRVHDVLETRQALAVARDTGLLDAGGCEEAHA